MRILAPRIGLYPDRQVPSLRFGSNQHLRRAGRDAVEMVSFGAGEGNRRDEQYAWLVSSAFIPPHFFSVGLTGKEGRTRLMNTVVMQVDLVIALRVRFAD
jgi:hypothetical protein